MNQVSKIQEYLGITIHREPIAYEILETKESNHVIRQLITYSGSESNEIRAYLFLPKNKKIRGAVLVHHQHNGEQHLGKSEVAGIVGDPFQFFCPALAKKGIIALAPDSICFEDRRQNKKGIKPAKDPDDDWLQHFNEMSYRILTGNWLMKKVIEDSSIAVSLLASMDLPEKNKIGILGHSYGGNTVIFHAPFDERITYSCSSGAVCSYKTKIENQIGIEMAEVIPGFFKKYDIPDLLKGISPRKLLILSADGDDYSKDAEEIYLEVQKYYQDLSAESNIKHRPFSGGHSLTEKRFRFIIDWFVEEFGK